MRMGRFIVLILRGGWSADGTDARQEVGVVGNGYRRRQAGEGWN